MQHFEITIAPMNFDIQLERMDMLLDGHVHVCMHAIRLELAQILKILPKVMAALYLIPHGTQ